MLILDLYCWGYDNYVSAMETLSFLQEDQMTVKSSQCEELLADKKQLEHELEEKKRYVKY